MESISKARI